MPTQNNQEARSYVCANCGGGIRYDISRRQLICASCGTPAPFKLNDVPPREHPYTAQAVSASRTTGRQQAETQEITCQNCGAQVMFSAHQTATSCPMCGSAHIAAAKQAEGIPPDGIIPFKVDQYQAQELFRKWVRSRWFAPNSLKKSYQEGKLTPVYLPYWTFDAQAQANYQGRGGRVRHVRRGKQSYTTVDWFPVSGTVRENFDDIQICASANAQRKLAGEIQPFGTSRGCEPYDVAYLAGAQAEHYAVQLDDGYRQAQGQMEAALESAATNQILARGFQQASVTRLNPSFTNVTYKQVLLPVWLAAFTQGGKSWHYAINGETGKVSGERPYSAVKIGTVIALVAIVCLLLILLFGNDTYAAAPDITQIGQIIRPYSLETSSNLAHFTGGTTNGIFWTGPLHS